MSNNKWGFDPENPPAADAGLFGMNVPIEEAAVVCLPIPFEATTSYGQGTRFGPETIRQASHQLDFFDLELGRPYEHGIATFHVGSSADASDYFTWMKAANSECFDLVTRYRDTEEASLLPRINEIGQILQQKTRGLVADWLSRGQIVCSIGGDHSVALGPMLAALDQFPDLGVLHLDAHADLRQSYEDFRYSHASVMHNVLELSKLSKLVSFGLRDYCEAEYQRTVEDSRIEAFFCEQMHEQLFSGTSFQDYAEQLIAKLPEQVYLSFDIDGLDAKLCPNTGTPVPGGLELAQVFHVLRLLRRSGRKIVAMDLVEVAPNLRSQNQKNSEPLASADSGSEFREDQTITSELDAMDAIDEWDGNVAARLLYKMIGTALADR